MRKLSLTLRLASFATLVAVLLFAGNVAARDALPNDIVLHVFSKSGGDGYLPAGGVVFDSAGNLYGATTYGGSGGPNCIGGSCGTVYQLMPPAQPGGTWAENILYNFAGKSQNNDGELPNGGLVIDSQGDLYGVTAYGGTGACTIFGGLDGCGTVFELTPPATPGGAWTKTTIYSFQGGADGYLPNGNLTFDSAGNLYGATTYGGGFGSCNAPYYQYCGTIFELSPPRQSGGIWTEKVLYSFKSGADGANPYGGLVFDEHGAMYGTTQVGGNQNCQPAGGVGCGTVFKLQPSATGPGVWNESILYRFRSEGLSDDGADGAGPNPGLVVDQDGVLYGTTLDGGSNEEGTIFSLSPPGKPGATWVETIILDFGGLVGTQPMAGLVLHSGILYGTVYSGGGYQAGTAFRLEASTILKGRVSPTVICDFPMGNQAAEPESQLTLDKSGALYGTTVAYDHQLNGTVFRIGN
jgi:uncharacterized repeat protein (TIGR03803 family)